MAIQQTYTTPNGLVVTYWRVANVYVSGDLGSIRAYVEGWTNAAASVSAPAIYGQEVTLSGQANPLNVGQLARLAEHALVSVSGAFTPTYGGSVV